MTFDIPTLNCLLKDFEEEYNQIIDGYGDNFSQGKKAGLKSAINNIKVRLLIFAGWKYTITKPCQWFHKNDLSEGYYSMDEAFEIYKRKQFE